MVSGPVECFPSEVDRVRAPGNNFREVLVGLTDGPRAQPKLFQTVDRRSANESACSHFDGKEMWSPASCFDLGHKFRVAGYFPYFSCLHAFLGRAGQFNEHYPFRYDRPDDDIGTGAGWADFRREDDLLVVEVSKKFPISRTVQ